MAWKNCALSIGASVAASAMPGAPVGAQVSFELYSRLSLGWGADAVPISEPLIISEAGRYDFELQAGVFAGEGFANFGVANWIGRIISSEPGLSQPAHPRVPPFDNAIGRNGVLSGNGMVIGEGENGYVDASVGPIAFSYKMSPPPPPPAPHGADEFVGLYRFSLTITDLTERDLFLSAEPLAQSSYTPISAWQVLRNIQPDPDTGEPGLIEYVPILLPPQFGQRMSAATVQIRVIPAPGVGAALVLAGVGVWGRRRRR